jgi:hypothetical protein
MTTLPSPFSYPEMPHAQRHGPSGYKNYKQYKPWLRDEFTFRCVYCLEREQWYPDRHASFSVDHVIPQTHDASRICDYRNLVYACTRCNSAKQDVIVLDPMQTALGKHLHVDPDGTIQALTVEGQDLIDLLGLAETPALAVRQRQLDLLHLKHDFPDDPRVQWLFLAAFGYPDDLPDLSILKPPDGNSCTGSEYTSYHARRSQNQLPPVY